MQNQTELSQVYRIKTASLWPWTCESRSKLQPTFLFHQRICPRPLTLRVWTPGQGWVPFLKLVYSILSEAGQSLLMDLHQQTFLESCAVSKLQISDTATLAGSGVKWGCGTCPPLSAWFSGWSLQRFTIVCPRATTYMLNGSGQFPYKSNRLEVQFSVPWHTQLSRWWESLGFKLALRTGSRRILWTSSLPQTPLPPPAFGLLQDWPANQCKCRRRPGPQLAFQRARTTSRALNKCRCDRQETQGWPPLHRAQAAAHGWSRVRCGECVQSKGVPRKQPQREWSPRV